MWTFILFWYITGTGAQMDHIDFSSKAACEAAARQVRGMSFYGSVTGMCINNPRRQAEGGKKLRFVPTLETP